MTKTRTLLAAVLAMTVLLAGDAAWAGRVCRPGGWSPAEGYGAIKAGGYDLDRALSSDEDFDDLFLGLEAGTRLSPFAEVGFTVDWLRRRAARSDVLTIETPYDLPVEGVLDLQATSTDLVPVGGILRLRYPLADGRFAPFLAGQLTWDLLRLHYREAVANGGPIRVAERSEYFHGVGTTLSIGAEASLDPRVGVLVEAGVHESEPVKELIVDGIRVDGRVDAGGEFVRVGLRFGFR